MAAVAMMAAVAWRRLQWWWLQWRRRRRTACMALPFSRHAPLLALPAGCHSLPVATPASCRATAHSRMQQVPPSNDGQHVKAARPCITHPQGIQPANTPFTPLLPHAGWPARPSQGPPPPTGTWISRRTFRRDRGAGRPPTTSCAALQTCWLQARAPRALAAPLRWAYCCWTWGGSGCRWSRSRRGSAMGRRGVRARG
jgi:hypothetical protein